MEERERRRKLRQRQSAAQCAAGNVDNPRWMQWTRALGAPPGLILDEALAYTGVKRSDLHFPPEEPKPSTRAERGTQDPFRSQAIYSQ